MKTLLIGSMLLLSVAAIHATGTKPDHKSGYAFAQRNNINDTLPQDSTVTDTTTRDSSAHNF